MRIEWISKENQPAANYVNSIRFSSFQFHYNRFAAANISILPMNAKFIK